MKSQSLPRYTSIYSSFKPEQLDPSYELLPKGGFQLLHLAVPSESPIRPVYALSEQRRYSLAADPSHCIKGNERVDMSARVSSSIMQLTTIGLSEQLIIQTAYGCHSTAKEKRAWHTSAATRPSVNFRPVTIGDLSISGQPV